MKNLLSGIGLVIILISCQKELSSEYSQYYKMYNKVLRLEKENNIQEGFELFKEAEKLVDFIPSQHLLKARSFAVQLKDCDAALKYFQRAVNNGFEYDRFNFSSDVCPQINNAMVKEIEFDEDYRNMVISLFESDQAIRNGSIDQDMQKVDSTNIEKLLFLIESKGYPEPRIIGDRAAGNAFIIMLHYDSDIGNKRLSPIIEKAYHDGMISPENYSWIIDRRRNWGPEKLDPYYYQLPTQKYFEMTKLEIQEIDKRRDSIGLKPLSEMNITKTENGGISIQM